MVRLRQGAEQRFGRSVVCKGFTEVCKAVYVAGPENETPAKLKRVFPQFVLRVPGGLGASPRPEVILAQEVEQVRAPQLERPIGFALFVHQQRKRDSGFVAEGAGIGAIAKSDRGESSSAFLKRSVARAQLRDVFAAEN